MFGLYAFTLLISRFPLRGIVTHEIMLNTEAAEQLLKTFYYYKMRCQTRGITAVMLESWLFALPRLRDVVATKTAVNGVTIVYYGERRAFYGALAVDDDRR